MKQVAVAFLIVFAGLFANAQQITAWVIDGESERPFFIQVEKAFNEAFRTKGISVKVVPVP
ncbi:hypothetical protein ABTB07_22215, partial [Acinetobacter baumannii]